MDHTHCSDTSSVIGFRQYTLHPGRREDLIELFEREFIETQERAGIRLIGQFRDLDSADRFVWLRGFPDMPARAAALQAFYGSALWKAQRAAANATMIDSDDVLLLRPVDARSGFSLPQRRASAADLHRSAALIVANIYLLTTPVDSQFLSFFHTEIRPAVTAAGAAPIAVLQTEYAENNFPTLPVRTGEHAFVWFAEFADAAEHAEYLQCLAQSDWYQSVLPKLSCYLTSAVKVLLLEPTARSLMGTRAVSAATSSSG